MRLALGRGLVGVVVGEMLASTAGIGHMMTLASSSFQMDKMFVGLILLAIFGYILTELLKLLETKYESWRA
jgi:NitT/TauT family transport system permease protein